MARWAAALSTLLLAAPASASVLKVDCKDGAANECLTVSVPADPAGVVAGDVALHVERLGAVERRDRAVLLVPGGPGQAGSPFLRDMAEEFKAATSSRDILVYDPRGTGASSGIRCPGLPERASDLGGAITRCEQGLAATASLYTTAEQVSDIERIRSELGIRKLVLYGVSYGTRTATAYAAEHPENVEALILDSPVANDSLDPFRRQALVALPRVLREACFGSCAVASADPGRDLVRLAQRLAVKPLTGYVVTPRGARRAARMDAARLVQVAATTDSNATVGAELPSALWSALHADAQPILRLAARSLDATHVSPGAIDSSTAAYLAATCTETAMPWESDTDLAARRTSLADVVARAPIASLGGFPREVLTASPYVETCQYWRGAPRLPRVGLPTAPTLVLTGSIDARTPAETARRVAESIDRAVLVSVPGAHHSVLASDVTGCALRAVDAFLAGRPPSVCTRRSPRYRTFPVTPAHIRRVGSSNAGTRATTLAAVGVTLDDMVRQLWLAPSSGQGDLRLTIGGLRGGTASLRTRRTRLSNLMVVSGVRVSGILDARRPTSRLSVSGPGAVSGTVDVSRGGRLVGHLGGSRVAGRTRTYGHNPLPVVH